MEAAMVKVEAGNFKTQVPIHSNDELGALADHLESRKPGTLRETCSVKIPFTKLSGNSPGQPPAKL
jgi:hypothetical protein